MASLVASSLVIAGVASCAKVSGSAPGGGGATGGTGLPGSGGHFTSGTGGSGSSGGFPGRDAGVSSNDAEPGADANCGFQNFDLDRRPAVVVLLQDRSTSMRNNVKDAAGNSVSRWSIVVDAVRPVLQQTQAGIAWGLKFFPDKAVCGVQPGVNIEPALNNAGAISTAIAQITTTANQADNLGLWDGTPVAPALRQTARYLMGLPADRQKYIVLATDGQPTCAGGDKLTGGGDPEDDDRPSGPAALAELAAMGIKVPVIGIAFSKEWDPDDLNDNEETLNAMAKAGGMPRPTEPAYYAATSTAELAEAFAQITGVVISCTFDLAGRKPPSPDDVAVKIDGVRVPRDQGHTDGWDYDADRSNVVLHGATCDRLKGQGAGASSNVQIIFGCPGIVIP